MKKMTNGKSTGLGKNQTKGLKGSDGSRYVSMTPAEVFEKYGVNAFIEVMKIVTPEWTIISNEDGSGFEVNMNDGNNPLYVDNVTITPDKFSEFRRCQKLGKFNMLEYTNWRPFTTLKECEWYQIITNYDNYLKEIEDQRALTSGWGEISIPYNQNNKKINKLINHKTMSNKPKCMKSKGLNCGTYNQKGFNKNTGNKNLNEMEKINVVVTDWMNGEIVNHIQQVTRKEFNKYNNGIYSVYELGGYKQSNGKKEYEIPKFYWIMRPSLGTPQTHPCANDVMNAAIIAFRTFEGKRA